MSSGIKLNEVAKLWRNSRQPEEVKNLRAGQLPLH